MNEKQKSKMARNRKKWEEREKTEKVGSQLELLSPL